MTPTDHHTNKNNSFLISNYLLIIITIYHVIVFNQWKTYNIDTVN